MDFTYACLAGAPALHHAECGGEEGERLRGFLGSEEAYVTRIPALEDPDP